MIQFESMIQFFFESAFLY